MKTPEELADAVIVDYAYSYPINTPETRALSALIATAIRAAVDKERELSIKGLRRIERACVQHNEPIMVPIDAELARLAIERTGEEPV